MESKLCACGCGKDILQQEVSEKTREFWKYMGYPKYIQFHGAKVINKKVAQRLHPRKKLKCYVCGNKFEVQTKRKLWEKHFCSWKCSQIFKRSDIGRKQYGSYRRGLSWSEDEKKHRKNFNKKLIEQGKDGFIKNLKNVNLNLRRRCSYENCNNYIFGEVNYCKNHLLKTLDGKIYNRTRAFLYSNGVRIADANKNLVKLVNIFYKTKEVVNENRTGNERNVVGCLQGNSQGVVVNS